MRIVCSCAVAAVALALGCTTDRASSDGFPIAIDRAGGAIVTQVQVGTRTPTTAVIDIMSPLTFVDAALDEAPRRTSDAITLWGHRTAADPTWVTRARYAGAPLFIHPCAAAAPCTIGDPASPLAIGAVVGADTLASDALRVTPSRNQLAVLPDIAIADTAIDRACDAELAPALYGGGTLVVGGTELPFAGRRPVTSVCLSPQPDAADPVARGIDATMMLSTGLGTSILSASRYEAWRAVTGGPALDTLPMGQVLLPSGPVVGRLGQIDRLALVGGTSVGGDTAQTGACRVVYAHHFLMDRGACVLGDGTDCPCANATTCSVKAVVELSDAFPVLIVADDLPLLQSLRTELRPAVPELDGILGLDALAATEFDVDYPHARLLFRCAAAGCALRPELRDTGSRAIIARCLAQTAGVDAGIDAP